MMRTQHNNPDGDRDRDKRRSDNTLPNRIRLPNEAVTESGPVEDRKPPEGKVSRLWMVVGIVILVILVASAGELRHMMTKNHTGTGQSTSLSTSNAEALFLKAGRLITANVANENGNLAGWIATPNYQTLSYISLPLEPNGFQIAHSVQSRTDQERTKEIGLVGEVLHANRQPLQEIKTGLNENCIMSGNDSEFIANRCSALLLLHAYMHLLKRDYNGAISDAFSTLKLDGLLSRNATIRNYGEILRLNGIARSLIIFVLQQDYPKFPLINPSLPAISRAKIAELQVKFNAYMSQRISLGEVLTAHADRYARNLLRMLKTKSVLRPVNVALMGTNGAVNTQRNANSSAAAPTLTPKDLLNEYNYEINAYIRAVDGQYHQEEDYPLQSWQHLLDRVAPTVAVRLRPMPPLILDEHADVAWDRMVQVTLAELLYEYDHHHLPPTLQVLVPKYLPAVPVDPFARKPAALCYRQKEPPNLPYGSFNCSGLVYSVGPDGVDDNGQPYETYEPEGSFAGRQPQSLNSMTKGDLVVNMEDETAWLMANG